MPDVTFVKGYGFPRGSKMDYAGMGAFGAAELPEADLFQAIPALDGYDGHLGDTNLPLLDLSPGALPVDQQPGYGPGPSPLGVLPLVGLALIGWALFSK